jgi:septal ring factor EnvC (AmiA/AmiB activator)
VISNPIEIVIILFILGGISVVIWLGWKGGAANPVTTGNLDERLHSFDTELSGMRSQVDQIEDRVEKIEGHYAKATDIERLEKQLRAQGRKMDKMAEDIATIREEAAERGALAKASTKQLDLIYKTIVEKGMNA